ncbi:hypothetical protein PLICRDRAFT_52032 [Plicaturopsis crispa FD-325 SS-3]|nr:hypothetical protein PLICRDRAFT_52032 [Plicaturopsis crispa FD-325 SS-3]
MVRPAPPPACIIDYVGTPRARSFALVRPQPTSALPSPHPVANLTRLCPRSRALEVH